ncbi:YadA-like family protein [Salmonella enterica]|nr:YadA-like family protein [Salmonella enterica]
MKLNAISSIVMLIIAIPYTSAKADDGNERSSIDVDLRAQELQMTDPQSPFQPGDLVNANSHTDMVVNKIHEAGKMAQETIKQLIEKTNRARLNVNEKLATASDPVTSAVLRTQLRSLDNVSETLNRNIGRTNDLIGARKVASTKYAGESGIFVGGRQISSSWDNVNAGQVTELDNIVRQTEERVASVLAGTSDESTEAQVSAAKATFTKGSVATGGVLTAPGAAAGDEKIILTEGVTNRTIPGQHGDLLMHGIGSGEAILRETTALGETKRNASLLMLGEHQEAKISAGESAILIGDNSKTEGNGIAIGKNATSGNDSIALGNNSVATGANELSIGNENGLTRKITHMADGTNDSDGATIHNLKSEISRLDTIALDYADTKKEQAITVANQYTDAAKTAAIDVANKYTDSEITTLDTQAQGYATAAKSEAVRDANQYSDDKAQKTLKSANDYTERRAVVAENNAVTRSNAYTDESSSRTLESANTYTNHRSVQAENNAVARSNAYTDNRFGELKHQVDRNEKRANGGIAGAMAMSGIVPVPGNDFSFGIATSGYRDQGAIATGVQARISPNANINMKAAWDSGNGVGVVAGLNIGW